MNKKISLGAAIAYMAIVAAVAFSLTMIYSMNLFNVKMTGITEREKMYSSLHEVDLYVRENYYGSINEEALQEAIARGYIDGLEDSNARYFTAAEYEAYTQSGSGKYVGVGLVTEMDSSGYLLVREVYPDSPAQMAGIKVGALITNVNGTRVTENNNESMAGRLRGEAGTKVTLTIQQDSQENNYELTLRAIEVPTVKTTMVSEDTAYISFTEWSGTTADQFIAQLNALKAQEVKGILLDVRGVTSNELSYAVRLLDPLLPSGTVAYSRDKDGNLTAVAESDANSWDIPLVVLADETTGVSKCEYAMSSEVENMCVVAKGCDHGPAPLPEEGKWVQAKQIGDISGYTHGIGWCAPQQGACKLSLNVKNGVIEEALVETIGCSGMTHSAAMAAEILPGKTILEALNTDQIGRAHV